MTTPPPVRYFCTYFDSFYLARGLALIDSLRQHCPAFKIWVLCFDETALRALQAAHDPTVVPISEAEFEAADPELKATQAGRTRLEYFFTTTASLPLFVLRTAPAVDLITYLDADMFFFGSPEPLFEELGDRSIAIVSHRFRPAIQWMEIAGIYNVGVLTFRRDAIALGCLEWWRARCIEWCYARHEHGRYGDQKYLDDWPARFPGVAVLEHKGVNVAIWNLANHSVTSRNGEVMIGDQPLICYHFHGLRKMRDYVYDLRSWHYGAVPNDVVVRAVYGPYFRALERHGGERAKNMPLLDALLDHEQAAPFVDQLRYRKGKIRTALRRFTDRTRLVVWRGRPLVFPSARTRNAGVPAAGEVLRSSRARPGSRP